ncbi:MAG: UpxY family transcription antiterminator [Bacteroidota bacterium]
MSTQISKEYYWHAIYTFPRFEKKLHKILLDKGIEVYLPLQKTLRKWKDRKKWVEEPYFRSYIFVKVSEKEYYDVINTNGAVKYVSFSGKASVIPESQILTMKKLLNHDHNIIVTNKQFKKGEIVQIKEGTLAGYEGEIINYLGKKRILIRIQEIGYSLMVETPVSDLIGE